MKIKITYELDVEEEEKFKGVTEKMIKEEKCFKNDIVPIKILDGGKAYFIWTEKDCNKDFLNRNEATLHDTFYVYSEYEAQNAVESTGIRAFCYAIKDVDGIEWFMICFSEFEWCDSDEIHQCVLIPAKKIEFIKFKRDYLLPFAGKKWV